MSGFGQTTKQQKQVKSIHFNHRNSRFCKLMKLKIQLFNHLCKSSKYSTHSLVSPRPFSFPIVVGGEEGKGLVALVSMTCAGTKIVALQSDCRIVN